jgi:hypothetical protein
LNVIWITGKIYFAQLFKSVRKQIGDSRFVCETAIVRVFPFYGPLVDIRLGGA